MSDKASGTIQAISIADQCRLSFVTGPGIPTAGRRVCNHDGVSRIPLGKSFDSFMCVTRGAANFDVFAHHFRKGDSWVIHAAQLMRKVGTSEGTIVKLAEAMNTAPVTGTYKLYVSANKNQTARWAEVEVRVTSVTLVRLRDGATAFLLDNEIREIPEPAITPDHTAYFPRFVTQPRLDYASHLCLRGFND